MSREDRVIARIGWRSLAHLERQSDGPERALTGGGAHAIPEERVECVDDGGGGHTEGGGDRVGACGVKDAGDEHRTACRANFLLVWIREGNNEQQHAYQE